MANDKDPTASTIGVSRIGYVLALLLFCLMPFTEISCAKNGVVSETRKQSGLQAALGGSTTIDKSGESSGSLSGPYGKPLMLAYGIFLIAGLGLLVLAPHRRDWSIAELICIALSLACIAAQYIVLPDYRSRLGLHRGGDFGDTIGRYTIWLYASLAAAVGLTYLSFSRFRSWKGVTQAFTLNEQTKEVKAVPLANYDDSHEGDA